MVVELAHKLEQVQHMDGLLEQVQDMDMDGLLEQVLDMDTLLEQVLVVEQVQHMDVLLAHKLVEEQAHQLVSVRLQVELYFEWAHQQVVQNFEHKVVVQEKDKDKAGRQVHRMDT
jgi:hypothetical protein